jgi:hypothetical protein
MSAQNYSTTLSVDRTPDEVFDAINNVRGWWSGNIEGETGRLGAEFTYEVPGVHRSKQKIAELVPGKKVVWRVLDSKLNSWKVQNEWNETHITFAIAKNGDKTEVRFSHLGLVPSFECFGDCSSAWDALVNGNLRKLIVTGKAQPSPW